PDKTQDSSDPLLLCHQRFDILNAAHSLSLAWPAALSPAGGATSEALVERPGFFFMRPDKTQDSSDPLLLCHQRFDILNAAHSDNSSFTRILSTPFFFALIKKLAISPKYFVSDVRKTDRV
ncbi:hypothetical protein, partial [Photobacterium sp. 1_MG-2023]|uniref:hypothetical protein n=1 Tax=Photobacterium sp. 1_MG-2023 TaxID=3062646 RepID=UPI0026E48126